MQSSLILVVKIIFICGELF